MIIFNKKIAMYKYSLFLLVFVSLSCTTTKATFDYDKQANFTAYKTYNYYADATTGLSDLDIKRLYHQLDSLLVIKGFQKAETPDILINIIANAYVAPTNNTVGVGVGGTGRNVGGGISIGLPIGSPTINQQITIDFVDAQKDALVWQAIVNGHFKENATPQTKEAYFKKVAEKALAGYPPK